MQIRSFIISAFMFCVLSSSTVAQNLLVYHVVGDVKYVRDGVSYELTMNMTVQQSTELNIPYDGKVEIVDIDNHRRIILDKPGRGTLKALSSASGANVTEVNQRYVEYVKKQMTNTALTSQKRYTDFATVTRQIAVFTKEEEKKGGNEKQETQKKDDSIDVDDFLNDFDGFFDDEDEFFGNTDDFFKRDPNKSMNEDYNDFKEKIYKDFEDFRKRINEEYVQQVRKPWKEAESATPVERPKFEEVKPVIFTPDEEATDKWKVFDKIEVAAKNVVKFAKKEVEKLKGKRQPQPPRPDLPDDPEEAPIEEITVEPVENYGIPEQPIPAPQLEFKDFPFTFYGTDMTVRLDESKRLYLSKVTPDKVADILQDQLFTEYYNNTKIDCLKLRDTYHLNDWAYLQMVFTMSEQFCGPDTKEAVILAGALMNQSGYKIKYAYDYNNPDHMYLLIGSEHIIYDANYFVDTDDTDCNYYIYPLDTKPKSNIYIVQGKYKQTQTASLYIRHAQEFSDKSERTRTIQSRFHPEMKMTVSINKNLIDFYDKYPSSYVGDNNLTRWAILANTPFSDEVKQQIYPGLRKALDGLSDSVKVARILEMVQPDPNANEYGLPYEYDDSIWGHDRAFFSEETLYYSGSDCEDHAILFTRLVRDLVGLDCILIYYPGHLAAGVCFNEPISGKSYVVDGMRFVVTDPTYSYAPIGMEMKFKGFSEIRQEDVKAIVLDN